MTFYAKVRTKVPTKTPGVTRNVMRRFVLAAGNERIALNVVKEHLGPDVVQDTLKVTPIESTDGQIREVD